MNRSAFICVHQRFVSTDSKDEELLEAEDYQTVIRLRGKRLLRDSRGLGQMERVLRSDILIRIHHAPRTSGTIGW